MKECEKIKTWRGLSETTIDLLHLMHEYGKKMTQKWGYCPFSWWSAASDWRRHMWNVSNLLLCKLV